MSCKFSIVLFFISIVCISCEKCEENKVEDKSDTSVYVDTSTYTINPSSGIKWAIPVG